MQNTRTTAASRLILAEKQDLWRSILPASRSVFGSVEFCSIVQRHQGLQPCLFTYADSETHIAYPFFLRGMETLPFCNPEDRGWDIKTPEYTGPIPLQPITPPGAAGFREAFNRLCAEMGIIAEFAHLDPWSGSHSLLDPTRFHLDRQIIYINLRMPLKRMWEETFTHACRKNIRRAQRENVRVYPAQTAGDLQTFYNIYIGTMDRNQATAHYYFPLSYFAEIMQSLPDNALILLAEYQGTVIAGTLYLHDDDNIYSYLGGANQDFQQVRPTNQVVYEAVLWGMEHGKKRLVLGGGYQPDDGIFRFKASFSPLRANFYVYRSIHLPEAYQRLRQAWCDYYGAPAAVIEASQFFPQYRTTPPLTTAPPSTEETTLMERDWNG